MTTNHTPLSIHHHGIFRELPIEDRQVGLCELSHMEERYGDAFDLKRHVGRHAQS